MKKLIVLLSTLLAAVTLCGCGAEINYYYSVDGDEYTYEYTVALSDELVNELEASAAPSTTSAWTMNAYMQLLADAFGYDYYYGEGDGQKLYTLSRTIKEEDLPTRDEDDENDTTVEVVPRFFTREYVYTTAHPMASVSTDYAEGSSTPGSLYYILENGAIFVNGTTIPPVSYAFPALEGKDISKLKLSFYWKTDELDAKDGEKVKINGDTYLKWTIGYNDTDKTISYIYYGVNPLGWYVVIFGVSLLAMTVVVIVAKKRGGEGKLVEPGVKKTHRYEDEGITYSESNFDVFGQKPRTSPPDIFAEDDRAEDERLKKRIDELFPPEEAEEIKRRMDEQKKGKR